MEVSKRLKHIAGMVTKGNVVCDVGTDHGYLAVYLIEHNIAPSVIAMDVAPGPLSKAEANIKSYGFLDRIDTRLSDGVDKLGYGEAGSVVMAGMGGMLITQLLEKGSKVLGTVDELILSPHTDVYAVRHYLQEHDYMIVDEKMLTDEEKFYVIIKAKHGKMLYNECELNYGRHLLEGRDEVLKEFLKNKEHKINAIRAGLDKVCTDNALSRSRELCEELCLVERGLKYYEM